MTVGQENSLNQWAVQKYDAVSKAAFDVRDNVQLRKTVESAESFNAGVVSIMKDAGIPDKFLVGLGGGPSSEYWPKMEFCACWGGPSTGYWRKMHFWFGWGEA